MKILIQARMGSKRLPGKMLMEINGEPLILFLLKRLCRRFDKKNIYVLTSDLGIDDILARTCMDSNFSVFRGDEKDVFGRFKAFVDQHGLKNETLIRLTGDNVLIDLNLINNVLEHHASRNSLFTSTRYISLNRTIERFLPKGQSIDIFNSSVFDKINCAELDDFDKEHVIPAFYRQLPYELYKSSTDENYISCSIDTERDLKQLKGLIKK